LFSQYKWSKNLPKTKTIRKNKTADIKKIKAKVNCPKKSNTADTKTKRIVIFIYC
jgi:hypothetical protein